MLNYGADWHCRCAISVQQQHKLLSPPVGSEGGGPRGACLWAAWTVFVLCSLTRYLLGALAVCATTPHAAGAEMSGRAKSKSVDV